MFMMFLSNGEALGDWASPGAMIWMW